MKKKLMFTALALTLIFSLTACGSNSTKDDTLVLYDGDYTEVQIVHEIIKQIVEENTSLKVEIKDQMTQVNMFTELTREKPSCDMMFSYDGTLLTTFLHKDVSDVPAGQSLFDYANEQGLDQYGVHLLEKVGLNNTYAIAVTQEIAQQYGVKTISDLVPIAGDLRFVAEPEFWHEEGDKKYYPFVAYYGLDFGTASQVDVMLKHTAIENGQFDVAIVYATDGLNRRADLVSLEDDLSFFPEYNGAILVHDGLFEKFAANAPDLESVLNRLSGNITTEDMIDLTYQVDVERVSITDAVTAFLQTKNLL